jgi:hypothetical protein
MRDDDREPGTKQGMQTLFDILKNSLSTLHGGNPDKSGLEEYLMSHDGDESLVLELLDEAVGRLRAMVSLIVDGEAMAHAAMVELERLREAQPEADATMSTEEHRRELQRAISLAGSAATMLQSLLDDVAGWLAEFEGHRGTLKS